MLPVLRVTASPQARLSRLFEKAHELGHVLGGDESNTEDVAVASFIQGISVLNRSDSLKGKSWRLSMHWIRMGGIAIASNELAESFALLGMERFSLPRYKKRSPRLDKTYLQSLSRFHA